MNTKTDRSAPILHTDKPCTQKFTHFCNSILCSTRKHNCVMYRTKAFVVGLLSLLCDNIRLIFARYSHAVWSVFITPSSSFVRIIETVCIWNNSANLSVSSNVALSLLLINVVTHLCLMSCLFLNSWTHPADTLAGKPGGGYWKVAANSHSSVRVVTSCSFSLASANWS
jgi:hypothetical protein